MVLVQVSQVPGYPKNPRDLYQVPAVGVLWVSWTQRVSERAQVIGGVLWDLRMRFLYCGSPRVGSSHPFTSVRGASGPGKGYIRMAL